jgi:hypothetical protein
MGKLLANLHKRIGHVELVKRVEAHSLNPGAVSIKTQQFDGRSPSVPTRKKKELQLSDHGGDRGSGDEYVCHLCLTAVSLMVFHTH